MQPVAVLVALGALAGGEDVPSAGSADRPPRLAIDPAGEVDRCRRAWARHGRIAGETEVTVWVDANGRVTGVQTRADAEPLLAQAAQCAALGLRYDPAMREGRPVAGSLVVPIGFVTPPEIHRSPTHEQWMRCYPKSHRHEGIEGRVELTITVGTTGKLLRHSVPPGTDEWLVKAADCVVRHMSFRPGTDRGVPAQATVLMPVYFKVSDISLQAFASAAAPTITGLRRKEPVDEDPAPISSEEEILAAYRDCYPPGLDASADITYEINVEISGVVRRVGVVKGSGDPRLDEAGACILRRLKFRPATFNGHAVTDTLHWPLLVRPPP
ncbi:MAG TPA: TonB family protein [Steroidobacteraceae bacterium]|nr:TonB family protein [Steroidobacteraceae bacterium]